MKTTRSTNLFLIFSVFSLMVTAIATADTSPRTERPSGDYRVSK